MIYRRYVVWILIFIGVLCLFRFSDLVTHMGLFLWVFLIHARLFFIFRFDDNRGSFSMFIFWWHNVFFKIFIFDNTRVFFSISDLVPHVVPFLFLELVRNLFFCTFRFVNTVGLGTDDILLRHCNAVYNQNPIDRWMKGCILPFPKKGGTSD